MRIYILDDSAIFYPNLSLLKRSYRHGTEVALLCLRRQLKVKVAMPIFGKSVAPCFEYSATIIIFTTKDKQVMHQTRFTLQSQQSLDRVRLLRDQNVNILICGGIQDRFEDLITASGIQVIPWVSGTAENLIDCFIRGELIRGLEV